MEESTITIVKSGKEGNPRSRLLIVTPTLGVVRIEWAHYRYGQSVPCNWAASSASFGVGSFVPMHYLVADAQNIGCKELVEKDFEWLLFWEDDIIAPLNAFLELNKYLSKPDIPVVSGLYFTKGLYSEPILYRGSGNGAFTDFKIGQKVWVDGVPTGFLLVHSKVIKLMYEESPEYTLTGGSKARKVFETPARVYYNPEKDAFNSGRGTSDLNWCKRVMSEKVLQRAGWPKIGRKKYPFLCDTNIFCKHIDLSTGQQFPAV